jgi:hypothetical protein
MQNRLIKLLLGLTAASAVSAQTITLTNMPSAAITTNDLVMYGKWSGSKYQWTTAPAPLFFQGCLMSANLTSNLTWLTTNQVQGTNLVGIINPTLTTNTTVQLNDYLVSTNESLLPRCASGIFQNQIASGAAVLMLGDSMTAGQGGYDSASSYLGKMLVSMYGDNGGCDASVTLNDFNNPTQINRFNNQAGYWFAYGGEIIYPSDGTNSTSSYQVSGMAWSARPNLCNKVGLTFISQPLGGILSVAVMSSVAAVTNYINVSTYSSSTNYVMTNISVTSGANDWHMNVTSITGTNVVAGYNYLGTNAGVQYWNYSAGSQRLDKMLACGTNNLATMYAAVGPQLIIYHAKDIGEVADGPTLTNYLNQLFLYRPTNCQVAVVGTPPVSGANYRDQNYWVKIACHDYGWTYLDLADDFSSYSKNVSSGLMLDGTHPNQAGAIAWGNDLFNLLGFKPQTVFLQSSNMIGQLPLTALPPSVVTNGTLTGPIQTIYNLTVGGTSGLIANYANLTSAIYLGGTTYLQNNIDLNYGNRSIFNGTLTLPATTISNLTVTGTTTVSNLIHKGSITTPLSITNYYNTVSAYNASPWPTVSIDMTKPWQLLYCTNNAGSSGTVYLWPTNVLDGQDVSVMIINVGNYASFFGATNAVGYGFRSSANSGGYPVSSAQLLGAVAHLRVFGTNLFFSLDQQAYP